MSYSIHIGVCKTRDDARFKESFASLTNFLCGYYELTTEIVEDTFLPDAQNRIADNFLASKSQGLLLLDDDHWGHTKEMVDCLIASNAPMSTIRTYSRHYPYVTAAWNWIAENTTVPVERGDGYVEVDLTGFPMTLLRRELFDLLDKPYFRPYKDGERDWHSDVDFCKRLRSLKIKPVVCFQHTLNHDKITSGNVDSYRFNERFENNNFGWYNLQTQLKGANNA